MILTFAVIEASLISFSWSRRSRMRRQQILMGGGAQHDQTDFLYQGE
jgi:hypothetical protein